MSIKPLFVIFMIGLNAGVVFAQQSEDLPRPDAVTESSAPQKAAPTRSNAVPKLNITWDCGGCTPNEKVPPLIQQAFQDEALKDGKSVSSTESVDARIYQFRQRNPGMRIMFGAMAGKDNLVLKISYMGKEIIVGDYSLNILQGMNALCEAVGRDAYKKIFASPE